MSDYIDGLIEGSHKKTTKELFAFHKCSKERMKIKAEEEVRRRSAVADKKWFTYNPFPENL
jgi:hypothetical protein